MKLSSSVTPVWGITGQIAAGKSTLAAMLVESGGVNIEVDAVGHDLLNDSSVKAALAETFGAGILAPDGRIDRRTLGHRAFVDAETTQRLNTIMHAPMTAEVRRQTQKAIHNKERLVLVNAALLYTMHLDELCDLVIYVRAAPDVRLDRIVTIRGMPLEAAKARLFAQDPPPAPGPRVIFCDNQGSLDDLRTWAQGIEPG